MDDRVRTLETALAELSARVARLELRLAPSPGSAAPTRAAVSSSTTDTAVVTSARPSTPDVSGGMGRLVPLLGRSCLVFCGAFLLRAVAEAGMVPPAIGVAAAFLYATVWLVAAWRAGRREDGRVSAELHGLSAIVIALPMLFETTHRFHVLDASTAAAALALFAALTLVLLWYRFLPVTAWAMTTTASVLGLVLARVSFQLEPFAAFLIVFGVASLWLAALRGYPVIQWIPSLSANLLVLAACLIVSAPDGPRHPYHELSPRLALILSLLLLIAYLGSTAIRLFTSGGRIAPFDVLQSAAVVAVGLGGAKRLVGSAGSGALLEGGLAALIGLGFYALAFAFVERRHGRGSAFVFATSLGLVLTVAGGYIAASGAALALGWTVLGVVAAICGGHFDRITLRAHAAVFLLLAAVESGLAAASADALLAPGDQTWASFDPGAAAVLAALGVAYSLLVWSPSGRERRWYARLPRFVLAAMAGIALVAAVVRLAALLPGVAASPAILAALRTVVVAVTVLAMAVVGRWERLRELAWLVYPLLAVAGCRMLLVDLRVGSGVTLFPTFAIFGVVLLLTPRVLRRRS